MIHEKELKLTPNILDLFNPDECNIEELHLDEVGSILFSQCDTAGILSDVMEQISDRYGNLAMYIAWLYILDSNWYEENDKGLFHHLYDTVLATDFEVQKKEMYEMELFDTYNREVFYYIAPNINLPTLDNIYRIKIDTRETLSRRDNEYQSVLKTMKDEMEQSNFDLDVYIDERVFFSHFDCELINPNFMEPMDNRKLLDDANTFKDELLATDIISEMFILFKKRLVELYSVPKGDVFLCRTVEYSPNRSDTHFVEEIYRHPTITINKFKLFIDSLKNDNIFKFTIDIYSPILLREVEKYVQNGDIILTGESIIYFDKNSEPIEKIFYKNLKTYSPEFDKDDVFGKMQ